MSAITSRTREYRPSPAGTSTEGVDRFTFRSPAQATVYFYDYTKLLELRDEAQKQLGDRFNARGSTILLAQAFAPGT